MPENPAKGADTHAPDRCFGGTAHRDHLAIREHRVQVLGDGQRDEITAEHDDTQLELTKAIDHTGGVQHVLQQHTHHGRRSVPQGDLGRGGA